MYLPLDTMAAVFLGGLLRWALTRRQPPARAERRRERGVLFGSGLVGGGGLTGVLLALWVALSGGRPIRGVGLELPHLVDEVLALITIVAILATMAWFIRRGETDPAG